MSTPAGQHFAEFYQLSPQSGLPIPACGSDSHLPIDGRFGPDRAADCALQHLASLQKLGKDYCGFALFRNPSRHSGEEQPYYFYGRTAAYASRPARNQ